MKHVSCRSHARRIDHLSNLTYRVRSGCSPVHVCTAERWHYIKCTLCTKGACDQARAFEQMFMARLVLKKIIKHNEHVNRRRQYLFGSKSSASTCSESAAIHMTYFRAGHENKLPMEANIDAVSNIAEHCMGYCIHLAVDSATETILISTHYLSTPDQSDKKKRET